LHRKFLCKAKRIVSIDGLRDDMKGATAELQYTMELAGITAEFAYTMPLDQDDLVVSVTFKMADATVSVQALELAPREAEVGRLIPA
jgi:hypothetical protein